MGAPGVVLVSCPINNLLATPRLFAPGGVAPPRHSTHYDSSARLARHENPRANRASYWWDRTLMFLGRDAHVHDGQHPENERLKRDDQVVKSRPYDPGDELAGAEKVGRRVVERRVEREAGDQQKYELAGVHVAEQPHGQ